MSLHLRLTMTTTTARRTLKRSIKRSPAHGRCTSSSATGSQTSSTLVSLHVGPVKAALQPQRQRKAIIIATIRSSGVHDLRLLTPGHFLIGRDLIAKPERDLLDIHVNRLNRWEKLQQAGQRFWTLWHQDYLKSLQKRPVNFREKHQFHIGDLVLLRDSNMPPMHWAMGRIIKLYPGKDRVIRNVRVRTAKGELDRHVNYLCLLPFEEDPPSEPGESVPVMNA